MTEAPPPSLTGEIVSIGDEMTSGARLDTNAVWLSRRLGELGIEVKFHSTVGDTLSDNVDVFRTAASRADVIIATGGLGPTRDDLTREALAQAAGQPLVMFDSAMKHIESMFQSRGRVMPERNRVQAFFPQGCQEIVNPQGTAPGIDLPLNLVSGGLGGRVFALPGVPAEMKRMFDETVSPRILAMTAARISTSGGEGETYIRHDVMKFFGLGESEMEERLGAMIERKRSPRVGITVSAATISLRITATGRSEENCQSQIQSTRQQILDRVAEFHFGDGEDHELQHALLRDLACVKQTLAVVELGRAAPLGNWLAEIGDTPTYRGGLSLGDSRQWMTLFRAESPQEAMDRVADQLAVVQLAADWVLVVDAYPAIDSAADTPIPPVEVSLMLKGPGGNVLKKKVALGGHPSIIQSRIAKTAMQFLRIQLLC